MNPLRDPHSRASKFATLAIFIVGALVTALAAFTAMGKPALPLWLMLVALATLFAVCMIAGRAVTGRSTGWAYLGDLLVSASIGFAFMTTKAYDESSTLNAVLYGLFIAMALFAISSYFYKRHPQAHTDSQE